MNSNLFSKMHSRLTPNKAALLLGVFSFIGFLDALYLTVRHYQGLAVPCLIFEGCEIVTKSEYAAILGVPLALVGVVYYLGIFLLVVLYADQRKSSILGLIAHIAVLGFIASLWFLYLQLFVIKALCIYCIISGIMATFLFIVGRFMVHCRYE